jgi:hypothetical protein
LAVLASACGERARPARAPAPVAAREATLAAPGLRAYRDPTTGAFTAPPTPAQGFAPRPLAPSAAPPTLVETPAPGGGTMINLQGTSMSDVEARRGPRGVDVSCATTRTDR